MDVDRVLAIAVCANTMIYWGCVGAMVVRMRRRARRRGEPARVLIPAQVRERIMWGLWTPVIVSWMALPLAAGLAKPGGESWLSLPGIASAGAFRACRAGAVLIAGGCLAASIVCWRHMGRHWRMAVDPNQESPLFTDGPFGAARHPIYALSILMMICSAIVVPTLLMAIVAIIHVILMNLKARNEEGHLLARHGSAYEEYRRRTGRFVPRIASWRRTSRAAGS